MTQKRTSKTWSLMEFMKTQHAQEALDHIQQSGDLPLARDEAIAAGLILALHSWTRNHTVTLHDQTGPP